MRTSAVVAVFLALAAARPATAGPRLHLELEGGGTWQLRNDFAVPGDTGTRVRLADEGPVGAFRGTLTWDVSERSSLRLLVAPLELETSFLPGTPVDFQGSRFAALRPVTVGYRFDSYRLSWYRRLERGRWSFRLGVTGKVRSARIGLAAEGAQAEKENVGFVPLAHLGARFQASDRLALELEADALAAPQGRAEDVSLRASFRLSDRLGAFAGYRLVEGGADNEEVYTFAFFSYAVGGVRLSF